MDLVREPAAAGAVLGALYLDSVWTCWTLEAATSAIPAGVYPVIITFSQRFQRDLPLVNDVPGRTGIRIHPGNTQAATAGCILLGMVRGVANVGGSQIACGLVQPRLAAGATLTVHPAWGAVAGGPQ